MKDAKGHGSNPRGVVGAPGIDHPVYNTPQKPRGYNSPVSPLTADYSTSGSMLRGRLPMSGDEHRAAGDTHAQMAATMRADHSRLVSDAMSHLNGADPGPLISGIVSDKFPAGTKDRLRDLAQGASKHTSAAFAHYAAAKMRLGSARSRYQGR